MRRRPDTPGLPPARAAAPTAAPFPAGALARGTARALPCAGSCAAPPETPAGAGHTPGCHSRGPGALAARWRAEAGVLRRRGAEPQALALESCASELEAAERELAAELLTLGAASEESGLSYSALEKAVRSGRIPNAGTRGRPRVRRANLPRKPARPALTGPDLASLVREPR